MNEFQFIVKVKKVSKSDGHPWEDVEKMVIIPKKI